MNKLSKSIESVLFDKLVIVCHCLDLDHRETIVLEPPARVCVFSHDWAGVRDERA